MQRLVVGSAEVTQHPIQKGIAAVHLSLRLLLS